MKHLLLIHVGESGRTARLGAAVAEGVKQSGDAIELRKLRAEQATVDDLLWADGLLIGTPEKLGYMAGLLKDFFDRTFYPAEGRTLGLPYALFISAGNDGSGTARAVERIATGYRWKSVADPLIVIGEPDDAALAQCRELGEAMAAGLAAGIF